MIKNVKQHPTITTLYSTTTQLHSTATRYSSTTQHHSFTQTLTMTRHSSNTRYKTNHLTPQHSTTHDSSPHTTTFPPLGSRSCSLVRHSLLHHSITVSPPYSYITTLTDLLLLGHSLQSEVVMGLYVEGSLGVLGEVLAGMLLRPYLVEHRVQDLHIQRLTLRGRKSK